MSAVSACQCVCLGIPVYASVYLWVCICLSVCLFVSVCVCVQKTPVLTDGDVVRCDKIEAVRSSDHPAAADQASPTETHVSAVPDQHL